MPHEPPEVRAERQFLANMSHEIRTPLTALLGFADLLAEPNLPDTDRLRYAAVLRRNGKHLLALVDDILDLSKIEAGRFAIERLPCSPAEILGALEELSRERAREKGLAFEVRLATPIPATVVTDPTRLRQILLNLVGNAIKFTPRGAVTVEARFEAGTLTVDVHDTGIGLTEAQIAGLFRPFEQADASMSRRFGGTGLGLAICRPLAQALGGDVSVRSVAGEGSTFTLTLPVEGDPPLVHALRRPGPAAPRTEEYVPSVSGTVLVVEDGPDNQLLVGTLLKRQGARVTFAGDGREGIARALEAAAQGQPFDLILLDMQLPELDGYGAARILRARGYPGPVVALTAHAMAGERERCLEAGCDDYLSKPIDREALFAVVARHLRPPDAGPPVHSRFADDPEMGTLIDRFVASLPERARQLRFASSEERLRLAHQIAGAAGGYGFDALGEAAARLEDALRAGQTGDVEAVIDLCARARAGRPGMPAPFLPDDFG